MLPITVYSFGCALMVPDVTLLVLDLVPERCGTASSLHAFSGSAADGRVAGVIAPLVTRSTVTLVASSLLKLSVGIVPWIWVEPRVG